MVLFGGWPRRNRHAEIAATTAVVLPLSDGGVAPGGPVDPVVTPSPDVTPAAHGGGWFSGWFHGSSHDGGSGGHGHGGFDGGGFGGGFDGGGFGVGGDGGGGGF